MRGSTLVNCLLKLIKEKISSPRDWILNLKIIILTEYNFELIKYIYISLFKYWFYFYDVFGVFSFSNIVMQSDNDLQ